MLLLKTLALLAAAVSVTGQSIDSLPECSQNCYYSSRDGSSLCTGAAQADMKCLCPSADFFNAIHDCVTNACESVYGEAAVGENAGIAVAAAHALCATATAEAPAETAEAPAETAEAPAETAEAPAATSAAPGNPDAAAPPASTPAPETPAGETQPVASAVPSATEASTSVPTDAAATSASAPSTAATSATENSESATSTGAGAIIPVATEGSSTSSASAPASTSKDKDEDDSEDEDEDDDKPGLSTGAKAGIGAAIGVASLVLLVTAALWIFRKRSTPKDHIKISDPVAGGRHYASDPYNHNNFSKATSHGGVSGITIMSENELEMKSRRYEDMVPRQQPRNMV